ncbi:MAG: hypothetical protein U0269_06755 [Polyangiales bacterium]
MRLDAKFVTFGVARLPNAAQCLLCGGPIERGALRLGPTWGANVSDAAAVHVECAPMLPPFSVVTRGIEKLVEGGEHAARQIKARCDAINAQRELRAAMRDNVATSVDPKQFSTIAPLRDREGRPVVRVYVDLGSAPRGSDHESYAELSNGLHHSHQRRYVFETLEIDPPQAEDPAILTVGALLVAHAAVRLSIARARRLDALRAQGVREVALWIIGEREAQCRETETALRAMLNNAGFSGDEARVLRSSSPKTATIDLLLEMLDEALPEMRPAPLLTDSPATLRAEREARSARMLEDLLADNDVEGARKVLRVAAENARRTRTREHESLAAIAVHNLDKPGLRDAAFALCAAALRVEDAGPLARWFDAESREARTFTRELESAARTLALKGAPGVAPALAREFLRHKSATVARRIADILALCDDSSAADTLKAAIVEWPANDTRTKRAKETIAKIRSNARRR